MDPDLKVKNRQNLKTFSAGFQVKRYPWYASATGNKHLDKFIEAAKAVAASAAAVSANASTNTAVASRLPGLKAQTASPSPAAASNEQPPNAAAAAKQRVSAPPNMDSEAGQSMLVFIVKVRFDLFLLDPCCSGLEKSPFGAISDFRYGRLKAFEAKISKIIRLL